MLNRTGKTWGACLKNNHVHESPPVSPNVSCAIQVHAGDLELASCDVCCGFWALLCGPESSSETAEWASGGGRSSALRSMTWPLRMRWAWMGRSDTSFPYPVSVT